MKKSQDAVMHARSTVLAAALFVATTAPTIASDVAVPMDEVRVIAFVKPVSTVYVGNPAIADITMIDARHAFILGKGYGATNIVALDRDGVQVSNKHVTVFGGRTATVTLHKGANQTTYACAWVRCEAAPVPGDSKEPFDTAMDQLAKHQELGAKAASAK